jgi:hypothetical protein
MNQYGEKGQKNGYFVCQNMFSSPLGKGTKLTSEQVYLTKSTWGKGGQS